MQHTDREREREKWYIAAAETQKFSSRKSSFGKPKRIEMIF
jgi:hypothetical protein